MPTTTKSVSLVDRFSGDRYWLALMTIFSEQSKLQQYLNAQFFDLDNGIVDVPALKRIAKPWSNSERFMLDLALHLFNPRYKVNLSDMDLLDYRNRQLAFKAMHVRYPS